MIRAECVRECVWNRRHWKLGEVYEGAATPPRHFEILGTAVLEAENPAPVLEAENPAPIPEAEEPTTPTAVRKTRKSAGKKGIEDVDQS